MFSVSIKLNHFLFFAIFFFGCACQNSKTDRQSKIFSAYLQKEFNKNPGTSAEYYFVVPSSSCAGCEKSVFISYKKEAKDNCFLITTAKQLKNIKEFEIKKNLLLDKHNTIDRLNLNTANTSLIIWEDNKIKDIISLAPGEADSIFLTIK
jgi:hypothetical protein